MSLFKTKLAIYSKASETRMCEFGPGTLFSIKFPSYFSSFLYFESFQFLSSSLLLNLSSFLELSLSLTLSGTTPLLRTFGTGGGQKYLRYILQIYISQFRSDYSGVKIKSEVHIIRSHLEKKNCKSFQKWTSYSCFCLPFENSK